MVHTLVLSSLYVFLELIKLSEFMESMDRNVNTVVTLLYKSWIFCQSSLGGITSSVKLLHLTHHSRSLFTRSSYLHSV